MVRVMTTHSNFDLDFDSKYKDAQKPELHSSSDSGFGFGCDFEVEYNARRCPDHYEVEI
jgi:hypothetical protein